MPELPDDIHAIMRAAVAAPSGDNSQPLRFVYRAPNTLELHYIEGKDHPLMNVDNSGTLIALGAAIENAVLEACGHGYRTDVAYGETGTCAATLTFIRGGTSTPLDTLLRDSIHLRHTNRKAYRTTPLTESERTLVHEAAGISSLISFSLIEEKDTVRSIARSLTTMEEIALQNKTLHHLFFQSVLWSKEQHERGEPGLHIDTLELPPPVKMLFKFLRHWKVARVLARVGLPAQAAATNAAQNASAAAFGAIFMREKNRRTYLEGGRMLERIWLAATSVGLSFQIVTGILFLARKLATEPSHPAFSVEERSMIERAYANIRLQLGGTDEPLLTFRMGHGEPRTARSQRRAPFFEHR